MTRMPSSRATIAAGTRPPRVMHTTAANGPASASRQASARASRWNWSHDTGNGLCGIAGAGCAVGTCAVGCGGAGPRESAMALSVRAASAHVQHKIEPRRNPRSRVGDLHQELAVEEIVAGIERLVREIELR